MTSSNRNYILKQCLEKQIDAILWLDCDQIYPADILDTFIKSGKDIIGSIYYRRSEPFSPVVYVYSGNPTHPYRTIDTKSLQKGQIVEVDGIGFGGMFVKMDVYKKMGPDMWMRYGRNFGIPVEMTDQESHDLIFCKTAHRYGFKIHIHSSIRAAHIGEMLITEENWKGNEPEKSKHKIAVIIPSIDVVRANKTINQLKAKADIPADYYIVEDKMRTGFMKTINQAVKDIQADYYVYTAEDAYAGKSWLKLAYEAMIKYDGALFAFNDGKYAGTLATFGMVEANWMKKNYEGNIFYPGYHSHYGDTELTMLALGEKKLIYDPNSVLIEVDYKKHGVNIDDKKLYNQRKLTFKNVPDLFA